MPPSASAQLPADEQLGALRWLVALELLVPLLENPRLPASASYAISLLCEPPSDAGGGCGEYLCSGAEGLTRMPCGLLG